MTDDFEGDSAMKCAKFTLALFFFIPSILCAQQATCRRLVPVSVLDHDGLPAAGLTAENFRGEFRGAPARVASANFDVSPKRMVIILDTSGSMSSENKFPTAQFIVAHAIASSPVGSQIALIAFGDKPVILGGLLHERQDLSKIVRDLNRLDYKSLRGRTALRDAIIAAIDLLGRPRPGDLIYAVTDGGNNASHFRQSVVEEALLSSGHRLFAFFVTSLGFPRRDVESEAGIAELADMVRATGGGTLNSLPIGPYETSREFDLSPKGQERINEAANNLYKRMNQIYLVEIELAKTMDRPRSWKLELVTDGKQQVKGLTIRYPAKLFPCSISKSVQPSAPN